MKDAMYLVRMYEPETDYGMIEQWAAGHGKTPLPASILPRLGIVVQEVTAKTRKDMAALWLYMDNSVGVCFAEKSITRPGLSIKQAKEALLRGLDCLKQLAAAHGYGVMFLRTYPAMARFVKPLGFEQDDREIVCLTALTKGVSHE
jgi:hypothetical protein